MNTGERIKERRKELGMSAENLAAKVGVSPATMYRYEKGEIEKVPGDILFKLSDALYVSPRFLMGWEEMPGTHDETILIAEEIRRTPGMRMMFDAAKGCTEEDMRRVAAMIKAYKGDDE